MSKLFRVIMVEPEKSYAILEEKNGFRVPTSNVLDRIDGGSIELQKGQIIRAVVVEERRRDSVVLVESESVENLVESENALEEAA